MPFLSPPPSTSARSVCLSLNTIQVQITGARLTKQVQQTLLRRAQQALLRQAQQALPNWPNIYKFAARPRRKCTDSLIYTTESILILHTFFHRFLSYIYFYCI